MTSTSSQDPEPTSVDTTVYWDISGWDQLVSEEIAASMVEHALRQEGLAGLWELAIRFVDDAEMIRLHDRFMDDPTPTDILTFPYDEDDDGAGGDIVISVDAAARNSEEAGWSTSEELLFLVLHGLLHIAGWNDDTDTRRAAMLSRQHRLLDMWKSSVAS